jgi:hypothetical protein
MTKQELSKGFFLNSTDHLTKDGKNVVAVEFELEVKKDRSVMFEIDFNRSVNMTLEPAPSSGNGGSRPNSRPGSPSSKEALMKSSLLVEPYSRKRIGILKVDNIRKEWDLKTKYSWTERETRTKVSKYIT